MQENNNIDSKGLEYLSPLEIENRIFTIRGKQVMLDSHLAELFEVETKQMNRSIKRNKERFPENFMFQLSENEWEILRCQIGTSKSSEKRGGRSYLPNVFTEHGITMLPTVLHSKTAINISILIINTFVEMRKFLNQHNLHDLRLNKLEQKQLETDQKFNEQYPPAEIRLFGDSHDRFLLIDEEELYHIGASLKDLCKKWFAFSKMNPENLSLLKRLN